MLLSLILLFFVLLCVIVVRYLNRDYYILSLCSRIRTVDGSPVENKVSIIPGKTIFGNNFDVLNLNPATIFKFVRDKNAYTKGKSFMMHFLFAPMYNVTTAEDVEEVLQSQSLLTKNVLYDLIHPFLGEGLLTSTDKKWHFRRKILTPAFHFNILQNFLYVFKEESDKLVKVLSEYKNGIIPLNDVIPEFTLNNVCDTALGVKLSEIPGNEEYRDSIHTIERVIVRRTCNPLMYYPIIFRFSKDYNQHKKYLRIAHDFSSKIIQKKREEFQQRRANKINSNYDIEEDVGKKKRSAMLDSLLEAELVGQIDHQGICDEVNTFMFEGYDTTSTCLIFALLNLGWHQDVQDKCYEEIRNMDDAENLTLFDYNKMEYLECVIKETLRLFPSVPFIGRKCVTEMTFNGLVLAPGFQINIHIYDIMRDPKHFPDSERFDPNRFLPENTINRHPFAFIPFSAGPRNCIGQKFAILEIKVLLYAILKKFVILPLIHLEDLTFENGFVLRTTQRTSIKIQRRIL